MTKQRKESPEESQKVMDLLLDGQAYASNNKALYLYYRRGIDGILKEAYNAICKEDAIPAEDRLPLALHATNYRLNGRPLPGLPNNSWYTHGAGAAVKQTWWHLLNEPFRFYKSARTLTLWKYQEAVDALNVDGSQ